MFVNGCVVSCVCVCWFLLASTCFFVCCSLFVIVLVGLTCCRWSAILFVVVCLLFVQKMFLFDLMCLFVVACCWFKLVGSGAVCVYVCVHLFCMFKGCFFVCFCLFYVGWMCLCVFVF